MHPYVPILVLGVLAAIFVAGTLVTSALVGPRRYNRVDSALRMRDRADPQPVGGGRVPGEVLHHRDALHRVRHRDHLPLPVGVAFDQMALFGLIEMVIFIVTVFIAYAYVWRRGGLEWD